MSQYLKSHFCGESNLRCKKEGWKSKFHFIFTPLTSPEILFTHLQILAGSWDAARILDVTCNSLAKQIFRMANCLTYIVYQCLKSSFLTSNHEIETVRAQIERNFVNRTKSGKELCVKKFNLLGYVDMRRRWCLPVD